MSGDVFALADLDAVAERASQEIARRLRDAIAARGTAHLALSGGTTPRRTYELLSEAPQWCGPIEWDAVEIWFADERCVPPDDPASNYLMVAETLLDKARIDDRRAHRMEGELGPDEGAARYAQALLPYAQDGPLPVLDVAVLGIGPDGHIASLFPDSPTLDAGADVLCQAVHNSPKPPPRRITLSLPVLIATRSCLLIATGESKADAIGKAMATPTHHVPASLLPKERLTTIIDHAAASSLPG